MSEEEFFNRLLNKIDKEFGYDVASTLELMFMTKEKKIEQLENIRKEAIEELSYMSTDAYVEDYDIREKHYNLLMNILDKGDNNEKNE